jgi:alpha-beta hydrolase superfamily lysophospholipase
MVRLGEGRFEGDRLFYRRWVPSDDTRGHVVLSHGFAEHSGRYEHVAAALLEGDLSVWALDHRGHGHSQGERADIESVAAAVADLGLFLELVRAQMPDGPLFLVGHSMGGLIATAFAEKYQDQLAGLALSGALLHLAPEVAALADQEEIPDLGLADAVSSDPAVVQAYKDDPLVYLGPPPAGFLRAAVQGVEEARAALDQLTLPILVMHGSADLLVSPQALRDVVARVASQDLTARLWPGLWHEIFNEPAGAAVLDVLRNWITERVA